MADDAGYGHVTSPDMVLRAAGEQFTTRDVVRSTANCGCINDQEPDDDLLDRLIDQASDVLCRLSGGRVYGRMTVTLRPCRSGCAVECPCCGLDRVPLWGPDPVVSEVVIDGDIINPSSYRIHRARDGYGLVKQGGTMAPSSWPSWQDLWKDDTEVGTFAITLSYGYHIDWVIEKAANELVCYFSQQDEIKKNTLQRGVVSASYNSTNVSLEERLASARGLDASTAVGAAMEQFFAVYGSGPRSMVWAPELESGWTMHVFGS